MSKNSYKLFLTIIIILCPWITSGTEFALPIYFVNFISDTVEVTDYSGEEITLVGGNEYLHMKYASSRKQCYPSHNADVKEYCTIYNKYEAKTNNIKIPYAQVAFPGKINFSNIIEVKLIEDPDIDISYLHSSEYEIPLFNIERGRGLHPKRWNKDGFIEYEDFGLNKRFYLPQYKKYKVSELLLLKTKIHHLLYSDSTILMDSATDYSEALINISHILDKGELRYYLVNINTKCGGGKVLIFKESNNWNFVYPDEFDGECD